MRLGLIRRPAVDDLDKTAEIMDLLTHIVFGITTNLWLTIEIKIFEPREFDDVLNPDSVGRASLVPTADLKKRVHLDEQLMKGLTVDGASPLTLEAVTAPPSDRDSLELATSTSPRFASTLAHERTWPCRTTVVERNSDLPCVHGLIAT